MPSVLLYIIALLYFPLLALLHSILTLFGTVGCE